VPTAVRRIWVHSRFHTIYNFSAAIQIKGARAGKGVGIGCFSFEVRWSGALWGGALWDMWVVVVGWALWGRAELT